MPYVHTGRSVRGPNSVNTGGMRGSAPPVALTWAVALTVLTASWSASVLAAKHGQHGPAGARQMARSSASHQSATTTVTAHDLELLLRAGRALDERRFAEAVRLYREAAALNPRDGQPLVMAGVAGYQIPSLTTARRDLRQALERPLADEDRELAHVYLDLIARDLQSRRDNAEPGRSGSQRRCQAGRRRLDRGTHHDSGRRLRQQRPPGPAWQPGHRRPGLDTAAGRVVRRGRHRAGAGPQLRKWHRRRSSAMESSRARTGIARWPISTSRSTWLRSALAYNLGDAVRVALTATGDLSFTGLGTSCARFSGPFAWNPRSRLAGGSCA